MSTLTRRELAAALAAPGILLAQAPPSAPAASGNDELNAARAQNRENAAELDAFPLPMSAEPATVFKP